MHFFLRPSYHPAWRIFVPKFRRCLGTETDHNAKLFKTQEYLREHCRWGGSDKEEAIDDVVFIGYEFRNASEAHAALGECFKLMGQIEE